MGGVVYLAFSVLVLWQSIIEEGDWTDLPWLMLLGLLGVVFTVGGVRILVTLVVSEDD